MTREEVLKHPAYWFEYEQNELYRQVSEYMEVEKINRTELAKRLKVSKGYVSQILNGNFNYTLKRWIELCLAIGIVPNGYKKIEDVIKEDFENKNRVVNINNYERTNVISGTQKQVFSSANNIRILTNASSSHGQGLSIVNSAVEMYKLNNYQDIIEAPLEKA